MTTPQDIQEALDGMPNLYGDVTQRPQPQLARWYDRHFKTIRHVLQSHAPEAIPVDAEALKKGNHNVNNPLYRDYNIGWNACIDELLRRGFRQEGGS